MRFVLVVGTTRTAEIDGITAAGADPAMAVHTPAADAEIVTFGRPVWAPVTPISPTGCPTPAVVTRAVREVLGFDVLVVDAGLGTETAAPTVAVGAAPGGDVRSAVAVPDAEAIFTAARRLGAALPDAELLLAESIPGGTTTALGVFEALGIPHGVSSSLRENPIDLKAKVVETGLEESGLDPGDLAGDPLRTIRLMGDPVLAVVAGVTVGALGSGTAVTLAGGTQMVAAAGMVRALGVAAPLKLATTTFVAEDDTADIRAAARRLDLELTVTDPAFPAGEHAAFEAYRAGDAKEGVGMGGALAQVRTHGRSMAAVRKRVIRVCERVTEQDGP